MVRRDHDAKIRMFILHIVLLVNRFKNLDPCEAADINQLTYLRRKAISWEIKKSELRLKSVFIGKNEMRNCYQILHNHLPEELFFRDFELFVRKASHRSNYKFHKYLEAEEKKDQQDDYKVLQGILLENILGKNYQQYPEFAEKLALYTIAHKNYLESLSYNDIKNHKINWGLSILKKIE